MQFNFASLQNSIVSLLSIKHPLKLAMLVGGHHPDGSMGDGRRLSIEKATLWAFVWS